MRLVIGGALVAGCFLACGDETTSDNFDDDGGSGGATPDCPAGQFYCNTECTALAVDPDNCGVCGTQCGPDEVCTNGACGTDCGSNTKCGNVCVDLQTDQQHCGACDSPCPAGQSCDGMGACAVKCPPNLSACGSTCVDLNTDESHCGACDAPCTGGLVCDGDGMCNASCVTGRINCAGSCIDPLTEEAFCGATGDCMGANAGSACSGAELCTNGSCDAVTCNDQFEPTANSNDTEATAKSLSVDPVSDCADPAVESGVVSGPEADWYRYQGSDDFGIGCSVVPTVSFTMASADAQLCAFFECIDTTATTQFSCPMMTTNATSPDGRYGCCATGSDVSIAMVPAPPTCCSGSFEQRGAFEPPVRSVMRRLRWSLAWTALAVVACHSASAWAHDGDHRSMPNHVTAGIAPLDAMALRGTTPAVPAVPRDTISGYSVTLGYGHQLFDDFELHLRWAYAWPHTFVESSDHDLHVFRGTMRALMRAELSPRAQLYAAFDGGALFALVDELGAGATAGAALGVRGWLTHHTGFWAELGVGYGGARFDEQHSLQIGTPLKMTLGWIDRF
jgi:hypothetical protein